MCKVCKSALVIAGVKMEYSCRNILMQFEFISKKYLMPIRHFWLDPHLALLTVLRFQHYFSKATHTFQSWLAKVISRMCAQISRFIRLTWDPPGANRTQVGPMLAPWTLLARSLSWPLACNIFCCDVNKNANRSSAGDWMLTPGWFIWNLT